MRWWRPVQFEGQKWILCAQMGCLQFAQRSIQGVCETWGVGGGGIAVVAWFGTEGNRGFGDGLRSGKGGGGLD